MDQIDKEIAIEKYLSSLEYDYNNVKLMCKFIITEDERYDALIKESLRILDKKIKNVKKASNEAEAKKYVKMKKILKEFGDSNGR